MTTLMKGEKWKDAIARFSKNPIKHPIHWPLWAEDKIDGIRVDLRWKVHGLDILSYATKPLYNLETYLEPMYAFMARNNLSQLDLEVQVNGCFDDTYRLLRSKKGPPKDLVIERVDVYMLDLPDFADEPYQERRNMLNGMVANFDCGTCNVYLPPGHLVWSIEAADAAYADARIRFREGLIYKTLDHLYVPGGRTWSWLKRKPEETHDGKITEIIQAHSLAGEPLDRAGSVRVVLEDGTTADPSGIAHALGADMFRNQEKYIGQWIEFTCMERDRAGGYRHPIFKRLREDKQ